VKVQDIMTRKVISVKADDAVLLAARLMLQNRISGLPVLDETGNLVGMVTEGDFLRRGEIGTQRHRPKWLEFLIGPGRLAGEYVRACGRKVGEIMTPEPYTITEDAMLETVVELMEKHRIKRLPVVRNDRVVGIVSRANLLRALASLARQVPAPALSDTAIRDQILAACDKQPWATDINVVVTDGIVELRGAIFDYRERDAFVIAAENVPGVKAVHDHLVWVEPMSGMALLSAEDEARERSTV
jgi:CBS domain-containing protein